MSKIYITGHRNPDMDSICAAYSYAVLKNYVDPDHEYQAVRCGHLNENVKTMLAALDITAPPYMRDVFPKVSDVMITSQELLEDTLSLKDIAPAWLRQDHSVIPMAHEGVFSGLLSVDDIANWAMSDLASGSSGPVVPRVCDIIGDHSEPIPVNELFEDARLKLIKSGARGLPVFDEAGFCGYVTRRCFLKAPKYQVILVDHNEPRQSIRGINTAEIVEIIDHHRIDSVSTEQPVFIDAEPLGSTCTIVFMLFSRHQAPISERVAKVLLAGILSDTVILKSPTTTETDRRAARSLAGILETSVQEFGEKMFSQVKGLSARDPEEAIASDFKIYTEQGTTVGIGQCEVTTIHDLSDYDQVYLKALEDHRAKNGLDWAVLMVTDIIHENSVLLVTNHRANQYLPYSQRKPNILDMPGVMSRKKQLLPEIISTLGMM